MIDIFAAAHIAQLEAGLRDRRDWPQDPPRVSGFRLAMLTVVLGAMAACTVSSLHPRPDGIAVAAVPGEEISASHVGTVSRRSSH